MKYLKILLIHLLLAFSNLLLAQQYPVNVSSNLVTPMPSKLSNFYLDNVQKFFVTLTNKDLTNLSIPVKLKLTIIGSSVQIASRVGVEIGVAPILLDAGVPLTLTQQDLAPYFNINNVDFVGGFSKSQYTNTGVLPEGNYAVSVQVLDFYNNRPLSKPFSMYGSIFFSQPPTLLSPQVNNTINGQETKIIPFNWVPAHLNNRDVVAGGYKYIFTLKELLLADQNINQAYVTGTTKLVEEVSTNQFMLNTLVTPLLSGRKYAWTVQVKANNPEAQSTLANNGISPIWGFTYDDNCPMPTNVKAIIQGNNSTISWTNSTLGKVSSVRYKEVNGVEYEKQLIPNASTVSLSGLLYGKSYEYALVVKCGSNTLVMNARSFTVPPKSNSVKATGGGLVYWGVREGQKNSDYAATGVDAKTIFQGIATKTIATLIPNHKLDLSAESNDATITLNSCVGTVINRKVLKGAKVVLWENDAILETGTTDAKGAYEMAIDTGRMIDNTTAKYYLKFSRPDNLMGRDSIDLSKLRTGKDILNKIKERQITLFSSDYLVIHPVVYVGVNQMTTLRKKAGGTVEVFIHTDDTKSLPNRILGYTENIPTNEPYNGESYALIGTLNDVNAFLPIETFNPSREKLLFKVSLKDYPTQYYSIKTLPENWPSKIVNIPLDYNPMVKIQGKVYKNVQKELESLNTSAVIAYDNITKKVLDGTTTNSDGTYVLQSIPFSQVKNIVCYAAPFNESTKAIDKKRATENYNFSAATVQDNTVNQDMNYGKTLVDIVYGQALLSETGKAVANAVIYYNDARVGKTSDDGFFAFKLNASQREPEKFKIVCDGKVLDESQTMRIVQTAFSQWAVQTQPNAYNKTNVNKNKPNSPLLNHFVTYSKQYGDPSPQTISILVDTTLEKLGNYYLANCALKQTFHYTVIATYRGVKQTVLLKDLEEDRMIPMNTADTTLRLSPDIDRYQVTISPAPNQTPFLDIKNLVINFSPDAPSVTVVLTPLIKITGTVTAKLSNKTIDAATIKVDRLNAQTVSNTEGVFEVVFGETSEAKLTISKEGYFAKDTLIKLDNANRTVVNIQLEAAPGIPIAQLAGFDVAITRQTYMQDSTYRISGRVLLNNPNDIFSLGDQTTPLTFNNILVHVGQDGNARPLLDSIPFAESQVNGKMFDFAPITIHKIQLKKKLEVQQFSMGAITGLVTVNVSTFPQINKNYPFKFGDATLQMLNKFPHIYLFTSDKQKIKIFDKESVAFSLKFNQVEQDYAKSEFLKTGSINVRQDSCTIYKRGINLIGYVTLPNATFPTNSNASFKDLLIDTHLGIRDYEINFSTPWRMPMKKWNLEIEKIQLVDLNSPVGRGLSFDGKLYLTKKNQKTQEGQNVLTAEAFEIRSNEGGGAVVTAKFSAPPSGISIRSLTFMPQSKELELLYTDADGLSLKSPGKITIFDAKSKFTAITDVIFPSTGLEVDYFMIKSKNWAVSASLKSNAVFDFKGIKLAPTSQAILNLSTDISIVKMKAYLSGTPQQEPSASSDEFDEANPKIGWALGINAEVRVEEAGISNSNNGSITTPFIVGSFDNAIDYSVNNIDIKLETPSIRFDAFNLPLKLTGDSIGIAGVGTLKIGIYALGNADFFYYKIRNKDIAFKGKLQQNIRNIETGPITWDNVEAGFEYINATKNVDAYLKGIGLPNKETMESTTVYFDVKKLKVAFNISNCGNEKPILTGDSEVFLRQSKQMPFQQIKNVTTDVDFCKNILLLAVHSDMNEYMPEMQIRIDGVLYVTKGSGSNSGMLLMNVNGRVRSHSILDVSAQIGLGINFDINREGMPREVIDAFNNLPPEAKYGPSKNLMTALAVKFTRTVNMPYTKNTFDYLVVSATVAYSSNITMDGNLIANFGTNTYSGDFGVRGNFSGSVEVSLLGFNRKVGLNADFDAKLSGSYSPSNGLVVNGYLRANVQVEMGSCYAKCNTICAEAYAVGLDTGAKACVNFKMSAGWSTKDGFYYSGASGD